MSEQSPLTWPYVTVGALGASAGTVLFAWRGTLQWMPPFAGIIIAFCAVVIPMMAVNGLTALFLADDNWRPGLTRAAVVTALFGLVPMSAGAAWFSPSVRSLALAQLPDTQKRGAASHALDDPSTAVASDACADLIQIGPVLERQALLDALETRKSVAVACLNRSFQTKEAQQRASSYATVITKRWQQRAFKSNSPRVACREMTYGLELPTKKTVGAPALLTCALDGPSMKLRTCCSEQLVNKVGSGSTLVDALGGSMDSEVGSRLLGPFLAASLHQHQMSEEQRQLARDLGLSSPAVRRFAIRLACSSLKAGSNEQVIGRQLQAWIADDKCVGTAENLDGSSHAGVRRVCDEALTMLEGADRPAQALCHVADQQRTEDTMNMASALVDAAIGGAELQKYRAAIRRGYAAQSSPDALRNQILSMVRDVKPGRGSGQLRPSQLAERLAQFGRAANQGGLERARNQHLNKMITMAERMRSALGKHDIAAKTKQLDSMTKKDLNIPDSIKNMSEQEQKKFKKRFDRVLKRIKDKRDEQ